MTPELFDDRPCELGEGPFWHPERGQLFWFDILGQRLLSRRDDAPLEWRFDRPVSAAGWLDHDTLLIAGAGQLMRFSVATGSVGTVSALEPDRPGNRANDGRADPYGGFWISTMGLNAETGAGSICRYYRGEIRRLHDGITIPNAISFSPDGAYACFADTAQRRIWRQRLGKDGWPAGDPALFLDLSKQGLNPDGAVFDEDGFLWLACWGGASVIRFAADGREERRIPLPVSQPTCPAFGGADLSTLYLTSAREGLTQHDLAARPLAGSVFRVGTPFKGLPEARVIL